MSGALDKFKYVECSPGLGREYHGLQLSSIIEDDELVRDLAITISERGVVFFDDQDISAADTKRLLLKFNQLTGAPTESGVYKVLDTAPDYPHIAESQDPEVSVFCLSSMKMPTKAAERPLASCFWHTDDTFENHPPTYTSLKLVENPPSGGDTLFVSSYGLYERLSEPWQKLAESLTVNHLKQMGKAGLLKLKADAVRGHPDNTGFELSTSHPVVRTNPVTGWKGLYGLANGIREAGFDGLAQYESDLLRKHFLDLVTHSSDLQIRRRWKGINGVALWDNRAVLHTPTLDDHDEERTIFHIAVAGEKPYLDPSSSARSAAV
ncbi:TauD/TfdA dioxygenase family protein [Aspergillus stella-maris]|uniref:TauD/TfdA dioxygenase family protein n=1 Tax=Aspergillus stella-maris TaxID=1810926 RepID=UPI003CCE3FF2